LSTTNNDAMKILCRRIIQRAILDSTGPDSNDIERYFSSPLFIQHQQIAEYPAHLRDTLQEIMLASPLQRTVIIKELIGLLNVGT